MINLQLFQQFTISQRQLNSSTTSHHYVHKPACLSVGKIFNMLTNKTTPESVLTRLQQSYLNNNPHAAVNWASTGDSLAPRVNSFSDCYYERVDTHKDLHMSPINPLTNRPAIMHYDQRPDQLRHTAYSIVINRRRDNRRCLKIRDITHEQALTDHFTHPDDDIQQKQHTNKHHNVVWFQTTTPFHA